MVGVSRVPSAALSEPNSNPAGERSLVRARLRRLAVQCAVAVAFVAAFEGGARVLARDPTERPDPYLGFAGTPPLFRPEGGVCRVSPNKREVYRDASFLREKPPGAIRVFCLGGSSVKSDAFPAQGTMPSFLEAALKEIAGPGVSVEVINAGGGGTGSYQYREIAREVRDLGADLIVVYPEAGERRFLPPSAEGELADRDAAAPLRPWSRRLLARSRLYGAMRDLLEALRPQGGKSSGANSAFAMAA